MIQLNTILLYLDWVFLKASKNVINLEINFLNGKYEIGTTEARSNL